MPTPLYIKADLAMFDGPLDARRLDVPAFWRGSDIEFRIAVFESGDLRDVTDLASLTVDVRALDPATLRPDPAAAPLMSKTVTSFNTALTLSDWTVWAGQHASVAFTSSETAINAGDAWVVITAQTSSTPGQSLTLCAGVIHIEDDGYSMGQVAPVLDGSAYSKAEADARFSPAAPPPRPAVPTSARLYASGSSATPADVRINGAFAYGGEAIALVSPSGISASGSWIAGTLADDLTGGWALGLVGPVVDGKAGLQFLHREGAGTTGTVATAAACVPLDAWSWVRARFTGSLGAGQVELWVNGVRQTLSSDTGATAALAADTQPKQLGGIKPTLDAAYAFQGLLARAALLNGLLTDAEWTQFTTTGVLPNWALASGHMALLTGNDATFDSGVGSWTAQPSGAYTTISSAAGGQSGNCLKVESGASLTWSYAGRVIPTVPGVRYTLRGHWRSDGTRAPQVVVKENSLGGAQIVLSTGTTSTAWQAFSITFTATTAAVGVLLQFNTQATATGQWIAFDQLSLVATGDLLAGLNLGAQPVQARTSAGAVFLDTATGVAITGPAPARMVLESRAPLTTDGFLCADQATVPAGYALQAAYASNSGTGAASLTLKWDSSGGTTLATSGSIAAGAEAALTLAAPLYARTTARKVYVAGVTSTSAAISLVLHMARIK